MRIDNGDGVIDETATQNSGTIRLVATGAELKAGAFTVNILTELTYQQVAYLLLKNSK